MPESASPFMGRARSLLARVLFVLSGTGCGNLTAGGFGEVEVAVSGDAPSTEGMVVTPKPSGVMARTSHDDDDDDDDDRPVGELEFEFLLYMQRADGSETAVSDVALEVEVDLSGDVEFEVIRKTFPAGNYRALRVVFSDIEVELTEGFEVGGVVISGPIEVDLDEDEMIEVVRSLDLELRDGDRVGILLDMNAATWLRAMDPDLRRVAEQVFAEAFQVELR